MPTKKTKKDLQAEVSALNDALEIALSASPIQDNNFFPLGMSGSYTDRTSWDRKKIFGEALRAWRVNPIARRIVRLMTSFIIGKDLKIKAKDKKIQSFLDEWTKRNKFHKNLQRWKDEDTRTGNLFFLYNTLPDKMTIIRAIPAEQIEEIITAENDSERVLKFTKDPAGTESYPPFDEQKKNKIFMLHFPSNQPVGSPWGEADLAPLLVWIGRFSSWLEDRVRLNRYRTAFMFVVRGSYKSETERAAREMKLNANPPKSGSTLVTNKETGEEWGILSAALDSFDASVDGLAIKKMIASGVGFPLHWLAEPESATRTTAEAAGTPTFRTLEEAQNDFFDMLLEMARVALQVADLDPNSEIWIEGSDITERDNATLALALGRAYPVISEMLDREAIDEAEFMRLIYKMFAEVWDDKTIPSIKRKPLVKQEQIPQNLDPDTDPDDPTDPTEDE